MTPDGDYAGWTIAAAAESEKGCHVKLAARLDAGRLGEVGFSAWGCPFLIAALEMVCSDLEGRETGALGTVSANELAARLSVPANRLGRLLLVEDAAARLLEKIGV
jgi:NifU-like protein involved in Fe-S cluster formation